MIRNARQYRITQAQVAKLEQAFAQLKADGKTQTTLHPRLLQAEQEALESQLADLREQLTEYDALRTHKRPVLSLKSFEEFPRALIQARIAAGMSQKELAKRLGLKEQQIQRYEATDYASASLARVNEVVRALGLKVHEKIMLPKSQSVVKGEEQPA
jgi:ribosome-binding protein aMBF1 (putative translation factor)